MPFGRIVKQPSQILQQPLKLTLHVLGYVARKLDLELDTQIPEATVDLRHALGMNSFVAIVLHDLVHLHMQCAAVQCLYFGCEAAERLQQVDFDLDQQVVAMSLEFVVFKFLHDKNDVTGYDADLLVAKFLEFDLSAALPALLHIYFYCFSLLVEGSILV